MGRPRVYLWGLNHTEYPAPVQALGLGAGYPPPSKAGYEATLQGSMRTMAHGRLNRGIFVKIGLNPPAPGRLRPCRLLLHGPPIALF